ncbi:MAG: hypothetical protein PWQ55_2061 [Chloroflexota bacterium]|nr:hypothetical protein [Chloroflexota bacterium]
MSNNDIPSGGKRFGYFLSILINCALIYVANNLLVWNAPYLTNDFMRCLWAINLSLAVTIFINFIFIFFDRKWFHSLMEAFGTIFSFVSTYVFWQVFPLDVNEVWAQWLNIGLIVVMVMIALSFVSQLLQAVRQYRRTELP